MLHDVVVNATIPSHFHQDQLGQDVFLIGPPGPHRRNLAMMYLVSLPGHTVKPLIYGAPNVYHFNNIHEEECVLDYFISQCIPVTWIVGHNEIEHLVKYAEKLKYWNTY